MSDIAKRLEKAEKYLQKGKPDAALEEYFEILGGEPGNEAVRAKAADLCITLGRTDEAFRLLSEMFDHEAAVGDGPRAIITYKRMARSGKPTTEQTFQFAQFSEKSSKREALEAFEASARDFEAAGDKKRALAARRRLVALDPSFDHLTREAELAESLGERASAAESFFRAGQLQQQAGVDALSWYERAYRLDSQNAHAALACGQAYLQQKRVDDALHVLEPFGRDPNASLEIRDAYARALMAAQRPLEAEPLVRALFQADPSRVEDVALLIGTLIDADQDAKALSLAHALEQSEQKRGRRREYINLIKEMSDQHPLKVDFLEYLVETFNSANREQDYCSTLIKLFDLYYAAGQFLRAGDALDRAAEVDPYEAGHQRRMEMLRGKIDPNRFNAIANRFGAMVQQSDAEKDQKVVDSEPTVLEDLMLQAEIFLQYSMRSRAVERLERVSRLFPGEEEKNMKLRTLYTNAGFLPKYEGGLPAAAPARPAAAAPAAAAPPPSVTPVPQAVADEAAVDNFARVTEITRNIYRQGNVKGVLFAAVNDIGRHWNVSRAVAALCTPGKPPSASLEYCAAGVAPSDVMANLKLIATLQSVVVAKGSVRLDNVKSAGELAMIADAVQTLGIESVLAVPLLESEQHTGILIMEQCGSPRSWRQTDVVVLKTIADQMALAVSNARLRSLMKTLAVTDENSGLLKRSSYLDVLLSETRHSLQQNSPMTLMLMQFGTPALLRELNDSVVESMLQQAGQTICSHVRQNDVAVRYDRSTIALLLSDTNDKNAFFVVDKLRKLLGNMRVPGTDNPLPITIGIAEAVLQARFDPVDIVTELINRVEGALESARAAGGNNAKSLAASFENAAVA